MPYNFQVCDFIFVKARTSISKFEKVLELRSIMISIGRINKILLELAPNVYQSEILDNAIFRMKLGFL